MANTVDERKGVHQRCSDRCTMEYTSTITSCNGSSNDEHYWGDRSSTDEGPDYEDKKCLYEDPVESKDLSIYTGGFLHFLSDNSCILQESSSNAHLIQDE